MNAAGEKGRLGLGEKAREDKRMREYALGGACVLLGETHVVASC